MCISKVDIIQYQDNLKSYYISIHEKDITKTEQIKSKIKNLLKEEDLDIVNYTLIEMLKENNSEQD